MFMAACFPFKLLPECRKLFCKPFALLAYGWLKRILNWLQGVLRSGSFCYFLLSLDLNDTETTLIELWGECWYFLLLNELHPALILLALDRLRLLVEYIIDILLLQPPFSKAVSAGAIDARLERARLQFFILLFLFTLFVY